MDVGGDLGFVAEDDGDFVGFEGDVKGGCVLEGFFAVVFPVHGVHFVAGHGHDGQLFCGLDILAAVDEGAGGEGGDGGGVGFHFIWGESAGGLPTLGVGEGG